MQKSPRKLPAAFMHTFNDICSCCYTHSVLSMHLHTFHAWDAAPAKTLPLEHPPQGPIHGRGQPSIVSFVSASQARQTGGWRGSGWRNRAKGKQAGGRLRHNTQPICVHKLAQLRTHCKCCCLCTCKSVIHSWLCTMRILHRIIATIA